MSPLLALSFSLCLPTIDRYSASIRLSFSPSFSVSALRSLSLFFPPLNTHGTFHSRDTMFLFVDTDKC